MVKLINELPYMANIAKSNIGRLVKLTYERSYRPGCRYTVIASIREVNERFGYIEFGHPLNVETKKMESGAIAVYYADDFIDITFLGGNKDVAQEWFDGYAKFHNAVMQAKGYDSCIENIKEIRI